MELAIPCSIHTYVHTYIPFEFHNQASTKENSENREKKMRERDREDIGIALYIQP